MDKISGTREEKFDKKKDEIERAVEGGKDKWIRGVEERPSVPVSNSVVQDFRHKVLGISLTAAPFRFLPLSPLLLPFPLNSLPISKSPCCLRIFIHTTLLISTQFLHLITSPSTSSSSLNQNLSPLSAHSLHPSPLFPFPLYP